MNVVDVDVLAIYPQRPDADKLARKTVSHRWHRLSIVEQGDTRVGVDIGGVFADSDDEELFFIVVVVCAFTPNPEILVCGTSLGKGEEPFTLDELRKLAGDDDFPYDSDILFCKDEDIVAGFGDDENAAAKPVVAAELIFFPLSLKSFSPFFCCTLPREFKKGAFRPLV